jgi:hypothetical protein
MTWRELSFLSLILFSPKLWAASCCGAATQIPSLITAADSNQVTATFSQQTLTDLVDAQGLWYKQSSPISKQTLKMDAAHSFSDLFQAGLSFNLQSLQQSGQAGTSSLPGDAQLAVGFKLRSEGNGLKWDPQIISFFNLILPLGTSTYETTNLLQQTGAGFYTPSMGILLTQTYYVWDATLSTEIHHSLKRTFSNSFGSQAVTPGFGEGASLGVGYNFRRLRLGGLVTLFDESPAFIDNPAGQTGRTQWTSAGLTGSYLLPNLYAVSVNYTDQRWLGQPTNAVIGNSWSIALQSRWPRE